ncbi:MAG: hypothetical protein U5N10_02155 [Gemmobacter sp.]|nr:hypothetical protein [Gemmobacter sp.]
MVNAVFTGAGYPLPPLIDPLDEAQWWASIANRAELRAYCLAAFQAMGKADRQAFLQFAKGVAA